MFLTLIDLFKIIKNGIFIYVIKYSILFLHYIEKQFILEYKKNFISIILIITNKFNLIF